MWSSFAFLAATQRFLPPGARPTLEMAGRFTRAETGLIASAAAVVFTRVLAFSLTLVGFSEYAASLVPPGAPLSAKLLAGVAQGAYGVTMAVALLATGLLSDRVGRKPVLAGGTVVFVLGSVAAALAGNIWLLIGARLLQGLGGVSSSAMAAVGETVPEERRTTAMALVGTPAGLAVFLGIIAGPPLAHAVGFAGVFWITAGLGLVAGLPFLLRPLPAPLPGLARPPTSGNLRLPVLGLAAAGFTVNFAMNAVFFDSESGILARTGEVVLGLVLLAALVVMGIASRAVDRKRMTWAPIVAFLAVLAASAPVFRLGPGLASLVVGGIAFFAAHATLSAVLPSQVSRLAGRSGGLGHGIQLVAAYIGTFLGSVAAGEAAAVGKPWVAFAVLAVTAAGAAALVFAGMRPIAAAAPQPMREVPLP